MHCRVLTGLAAALVAAAGGAQAPPQITEAEFLSALDASHPAVAASAEELALARARLLEASTLENPSVGIVREDPDGPTEQTDLVVSWQLPSPSRGPTVRAREEGVQAAAAQRAQQLAALRLEMREAYAAWALAAAREDRLAGQAARVQALAEREIARADRGEASGLEARRSALAAEALRARAALAAADRERARAAAAAWVPTLPADARPELPELAPAPAADGDAPRVRAAAAEVEAARLDAEAAHRFVASPELSVGWQRQDSGTASIDGPLVGLAWTLPVFDRNRAERAAAEARLAAARAHLELARREVASARAAAGAAYARLARAAGEARAALEASERMLDAAEAAFRLGEATLTDLLDTHRSVTEGALALLDLQEAALTAHRELEQLAASADPSEPSELHPTFDPETLP